MRTPWNERTQLAKDLHAAGSRKHTVDASTKSGRTASQTVQCIGPGCPICETLAKATQPRPIVEKKKARIVKVDTAQAELRALQAEAQHAEESVQPAPEPKRRGPRRKVKDVLPGLNGQQASYLLECDHLVMRKRTKTPPKTAYCEHCLATVSK